jgi:hypothetical protein
MDSRLKGKVKVNKRQQTPLNSVLSLQVARVKATEVARHSSSTQANRMLVSMAAVLLRCQGREMMTI